MYGLIFNINESFIKSNKAIELTFYITSIVVLIMYFTFLCFDDNYIIFHIIYLILYILCITFIVFLSKYTKDIHIICGLVLYIFDVLSVIVSFKFFNKGFLLL